MSYNGKLISCLGAVEAAYRDTGLDFIDFENAIEWTAELMGLIGVPYVYIDKTTDGRDGNPYSLTVNDYRCKLPDDLVLLQSIRKVDMNEDGTISKYYEMIETTDLFHPTDDLLMNGEFNSGEWNPLVKVDEFDPQTEDFVWTRNEHELDKVTISTGLPYSYKVDHGYVYTNFMNGYIQLSYKGFPIDADGYPLIPNDPKFIEAVKFYIIYKIDWRNWRLNPSPQNASIKNDSDQQKDWYVAAARVKGHIPSIDKMESIKNMWLRSNPKINEHKNGFSSLNIQERRYNQYARPRRLRGRTY